jgi:hypothetical protein
MSTQKASLQQRLRPVCAVVAAIGALLSVLAAFVALEVFSLGGLFYTFGYRDGGIPGAVAFLMALITVGGAIVVRRSPALGSALLYLGGCGGFLACGGIWLIPGVITLVAANLALWAIRDPFADAPAGTRA